MMGNAIGINNLGGVGAIIKEVDDLSSSSSSRSKSISVNSRNAKHTLDESKHQLNKNETSTGDDSNEKNEHEVPLKESCKMISRIENNEDK